MVSTLEQMQVGKPEPLKCSMETSRNKIIRSSVSVVIYTSKMLQLNVDNIKCYELGKSVEIYSLHWFVNAPCKKLSDYCLQLAFIRACQRSEQLQFMLQSHLPNCLLVKRSHIFLEIINKVMKVGHPSFLYALTIEKVLKRMSSFGKENIGHTRVCDRDLSQHRS